MLPGMSKNMLAKDPKCCADMSLANMLAAMLAITITYVITILR